MLILTRKPGESLYIGNDIKITVVEIKGHQIRIGIDAPAEFRIYREEIYLQILQENREAAQAASESGPSKTQTGPLVGGLGGLRTGKIGAAGGIGKFNPPPSSAQGSMQGLESKPQGLQVVVRKKKKRPEDGDDSPDSGEE